jgi:hypothetical protein
MMICLLLAQDLPFVFQYLSSEDIYQNESNLQSFYTVQKFSLVLIRLADLVNLLLYP